MVAPQQQQESSQNSNVIMLGGIVYNRNQALERIQQLRNLIMEMEMETEETNRRDDLDHLSYMDELEYLEEQVNAQ